MAVAFSDKIGEFARKVEAIEGKFAFAFVEGVLVKAIREGHWLLLDEINLAPAETLERLQRPPLTATRGPWR
jgi:midasin